MVWCGTRHRRGYRLQPRWLVAPRPPATAEDLYRAQTVVTGQGEANRMIGFASCTENVLIKVSGARAGSRVTAVWRRTKRRQRISSAAYDYRDQFSGKPTRDEQGTRDRPFDLTVDFDKEKIDRRA
jgi:hypothetical protein